jgi:hypothetical protein
LALRDFKSFWGVSRGKNQADLGPDKSETIKALSKEDHFLLDLEIKVLGSQEISKGKDRYRVAEASAGDRVITEVFLSM